MSVYLFGIIMTLGFAPGLFWLWYFLKRDKFDPEPLQLVRNSFLLGMAAVFPAAFLEGLFQVKTFWIAVAAAPIIEELCKFYSVYWFVYRKADFDEPMDGIVYAAATALGFASVENVFYLLSSMKDGTIPVVAVARAFLSVPGHALFSIMWGFALGMAKFGMVPYPRQRIIMGLMAGIGFHALFNFFTVLGPLWIYGMMVLIPIMWQAIEARIIQALRMSPRAAAHFYAVKLAGRASRAARSKAWYENRLLVVVLLFVFFPAGIYALWRNSTFAAPVKITYVALWMITAGMFSFSLK